MPQISRILAASLVLLAPQAAPPPAQQPPGSGIVAGQIVDGTHGKPIGGAIVTLSTGALPALSPTGVQPPAPAAARRGIAVANGEGRFVFRDVPAGSYSLTATLDGHAPGAFGRRRPGGPSRAFTLADGSRMVDANVALWRLGAISGTVRDDRGEPAVGISVWAMRRVMNGGRSELTFTGGTVEATDDRGQYRLNSLMPGSYVVGVRSTVQTWPVTLMDAYRAASTSGTTASVTREWAESGVVRMERAGLILGGWMVSVSSGAPQPLPGPSGTLLVHPHVYYPSAMTASDATALAIAPGDDRTGVDLTLPLVPGVRVAGVLMGPDGPAANQGLRLIPASTQDPAVDTPVAYSVTDAGGRFAFLGIAQGSYLVRAYRVPAAGPIMRPVPPAAGAPPVVAVETVAPRSGDRPPAMFAEVPVTVGSGDLDGLSLTLQPGARLSGRVAFEGATPPPPAARLQQVAVTIRPVIGSLPNIADARADADGRFTTSGYPPGRYHVANVTPPGPEWTLASVHVGGIDAAGQAFTLGGADASDVVVTFTDRVMTLSGTVTSSEPAANADSTVVLFPADTQAWIASGMSPRRTAMATTSASGAYQLRVLLPGDYLVVAVPPEIAPEIDAAFVKRFAAGATRVTLAPGESRTQVLTRSRVR
jgi:protocatechuate 3,4-dioxygenase beta subunit